MKRGGSCTQLHTCAFLHTSPRLDYAILSGGDIAPLEGGAVTQLHSTFDWAERSRKVGLTGVWPGVTGVRPRRVAY